MCGSDRVAIFDALHRRGTVSEAMLYAFDLLELDGEDFRALPLGDRKKRLARLAGQRQRSRSAASKDADEVRSATDRGQRPTAAGGAGEGRVRLIRRPERLVDVVDTAPGLGGRPDRRHPVTPRVRLRVLEPRPPLRSCSRPWAPRPPRRRLDLRPCRRRHQWRPEPGEQPPPLCEWCDPPKTQADVHEKSRVYRRRLRRAAIKLAPEGRSCPARSPVGASIRVRAHAESESVQYGLPPWDWREFRPPKEDLR